MAAWAKRLPLRLRKMAVHAFITQGLPNHAQMSELQDFQNAVADLQWI